MRSKVGGRMVEFAPKGWRRCAAGKVAKAREITDGTRAGDRWREERIKDKGQMVKNACTGSATRCD